MALTSHQPYLVRWVKEFLFFSAEHRGHTFEQTLDLFLAEVGGRVGMSRTGCCYDNAVCERFCWSLKHEWTNHRALADLDAARASVFKYIETFYNPTRRHQTLGYLSPDQYEANVAA